ncbi:glutamate receptor ionotropic, kainate 2-like [Venturia canescens]|uniref:glutamate receptor ionotropic, kainate 2-like n=1 Tax=Venturia canescens TaxID=32260 RepID=UPI001C9BCFFD|nr:glutamate receptor ionotropic, kainate 2-like [Venturia canescens]
METKFWLKILFSIVLLSGGQAAPRTLRIGAIFHKGDEEQYKAFTEALAVLDSEEIAPSFVLEPVVRWVNVSNDSFKTGLLACELIGLEIVAIFGPRNLYTRGIVSSTAARFDIPHIEYAWRSVEESETPATSINFYPDGAKISQAIAETLKALVWKQFTAIYQTNAGLSRIQNALALHGPTDNPVTVRQLKTVLDNNNEPEYRPLFKEVANSSDYNILLDVEPENLSEVLKQAREVKLFGEYYRHFITGLHPSSSELLAIMNTTDSNVTFFQILTDESYGFNSVESCCLFDSVFILHQALEALNDRISNGNGDEKSQIQIVPPRLTCSQPEKYSAGPNITNLMREIAKEGRLTGLMTFKENGRRGFNLTIKETARNLINVTGWWDDGHLKLVRSQQERSAGVYRSLEGKEMIVTTKPGEPYVMEMTGPGPKGVTIDNKQYHGYCIDLIEEIAKELKFTTKWEIVKDLQYGKYDPETKQWNGLMRRLLDHQADLAICDLTITQARESVVDFTMPFMNLGISILFAKPEEKVPELFSFLSPFSTDVWMYMATAFLAVSVMLFMLARMAPGEWVSSHPCATDPEELENSFNLMNSFWLTIGSLMQQGSDILPRAPSIRMVAGMWWFFTLIMVSSYTANLAAFLTATKQDVTIDNVEQLAAQTTIKYGAVAGGSTAQYFEGSNLSTYQRMWAAMQESRPSVLAKNNEEGVDRVKKGKRTYAFLMESTGIENTIQKNCDLMQVGGLLDNKGYGIALPPNSPFRTRISETILKLQERGKLRELKQKWWSYGSKNCTKEGPSDAGDSGELGMANVGGVFLVLLFGCVFSFIMAIFEYVWNIKKIAVEEKVTLKEAFLAELDFLMKFWIQTKPVKVTKSSRDSSSGEGGFGRAASAARSMIGSFSRLDILDKYDKDENPMNNKANNHKNP